MKFSFNYKGYEVNYDKEKDIFVIVKPNSVKHGGLVMGEIIGHSSTEKEAKKIIDMDEEL